MKTYVKITFNLLSIFFLVYLATPNPKYPTSHGDSLMSKEPADSEDDSRKAYFTNLDRTQVLNYYQEEFDKQGVLSFKNFSYRLNYPPEQAQTIIRDQTRSTFLEEIVHPFRESLFINGFEPIYESDVININGLTWKQKIIVKYVGSGLYSRLVIGIFTIGLFIVLWRESVDIYDNYLRYAKKTN